MRLGRKYPKSFGERNQTVIGVVGIVALVTMLVLALNLQSLPFVNSSTDYSAQFTEAGGLEGNADVIVSGVIVGKVSSVELDGSVVKVDFSVDDENVQLGSLTTATISTSTILGTKAVLLTSGGGGTLAAGSTIPTKRTTSPYDITSALGTLTEKTEALDLNKTVEAMKTITATFSKTPQAVRGTIDGLSRISQTVNTRDAALQTLLRSAANVTTVLSERSSRLTLLLSDGALLLQELQRRKEAIVTLLSNVTAVARQLTGLVRDNEKTLKPSLQELNGVLNTLNDNRSNIALAIERLGPFATSLGETVGSGPFFEAYVQNLTTPTSLIPILSGLGGK